MNYYECIYVYMYFNYIYISITLIHIINTYILTYI